ncbi:annexin A1-like [Protopterus annectens]|uniref:annexin A1-like n=1 Tax=Protopterus annectens TaxID=7888 RepID=UPI001CFB5DC3|nr:annexin A1-like [Protopterus annectens]
MALMAELMKNIVYYGGDTSQHCAATVKECANFNANEATAALEKAMKAKGVDEPGIIWVLANCSNAQHQQIKPAYQRLTGKPFVNALKKALLGQFEEVVLALMMTPPQYDAYSHRTAMKGLGIDEDCLLMVHIAFVFCFSYWN